MGELGAYFERFSAETHTARDWFEGRLTVCPKGREGIALCRRRWRAKRKRSQFFSMRFKRERERISKRASEMNKGLAAPRLRGRQRGFGGENGATVPRHTILSVSLFLLFISLSLSLSHPYASPKIIFSRSSSSPLAPHHMNQKGLGAKQGIHSNAPCSFLLLVLCLSRSFHI